MKKTLTMIIIGLLCLSIFSMLAPKAKADSSTFNELWRKPLKDGYWEIRTPYIVGGASPGNLGVDSGDVDGDGVADVAAIPQTWVYGGAGPMNTLQVFKSDGTELWEKSLRVDSANVAICDVDHDGKGEVFVFGTTDDTDNSTAIIYAFNHDGTLTWTYGETDGSGWSWTAAIVRWIAFSDINGDGHLDLIVANNAGGEFYWVYALDGTNGSPAWRFVSSSVQCMLFGDVTGDGVPEVILTGSNEVWVLNKNTGGLIWQYVSFHYSNSGVLGDLTGDHINDIVGCSARISGGYPDNWLYALRNDGALLWQQSLDYGAANSPTMPVLEDINNDGINDVIIGAGQKIWGYMNWWGYRNGWGWHDTPLWTYGNSAFFGGTTPQLYRFDINRDGQDEIIFLKDKDIYQLSKDGTATLVGTLPVADLWDLKRFGGRVTETMSARTKWLTTGDINNDGFDELICHEIIDGQFYLTVITTGANTPDFDISVNPASISAIPRQSNDYKIKVTSLNGFSSPVNIEITTDSGELTAIPSHVTVTPDPGGSSEVSFDVSVLSTFRFDHVITIDATSGVIKHQVTAQLDVPFLSVPYFTQGDSSWCYATSVSMTLNFYGVDDHPWDVAEALGMDHDAPFEGITESLLLQYLLSEGLDYDLEGFWVSKEGLVNMLDKDYPILLKMGSIHHTVVITGYSPTSDVFFIHDPSGYLIQKIFPNEQKPFSGVAVPWSKLEPYAVATGNYAIGINEGLTGKASASRGSLDITGEQGVTVIHESDTNPDLCVWLSGFVLPGSADTPGLTWRRIGTSNHPLKLDPEDYIPLYCPLIVNPSDTSRQYKLQLIFTSPSYETTLEDPSYHAVSANTMGWATMPIKKMSDVLGAHYGTYTISIALWCDGSLVDLVDLPKIKYQSQMRTSGHSPMTLFITDPQGRSEGIDPTTGLLRDEIPEAYYTGSSTEPQEIWLPEPIQGTYNIILVGTAVGNFQLNIEYITAYQTTTQTFTGTITPQEKQNFEALVSVTSLMSYRCAQVDIDPKSLNLGSTGSWITAYAELGKSLNMQNVNVSSILLNNTIPVATSAPVTIGDYNNNSIPDLMVKFDRKAVIRYIYNQGVRYGHVTLTITGRLKDGTLFKGSCVITVIFPDLNNDRKVDSLDLNIVKNALGTNPSYPQGTGLRQWNPIADVNKDGHVDLSDLALVQNNYGATVP